MLATASLGNWITIRIRGSASSLNRRVIFKRRSDKIKFTRHVCISFSSQSVASPVTTDDSNTQAKSRVHYESLRLLEWDKLCDVVASFAGTSPGRDAVKEQLWTLNQTYEDSLKLLEETNAAVKMHKHGACRLDFNSVNLQLVKSAIQNARRGSAVTASEAMAVADMLEVSDVLQLNLKATIKQDGDWYNHFMPLSQQIMEMVVSRPLIKMIRQVIDADGSVKDSASPALKRSREVVRMLERKLSQLMDNLIRSEIGETSFLEVSKVDGRWCIKSGTDQPKSIKGLLLSSDSGKGRIMEPLSAVPLNDELQQARASVAKAEIDVLLTLTEKIRKDLVDIEEISNSIVQLDVINARATYSLSFGGSSPELYMPEDKDDASTETHLFDLSPKTSCHVKREWKLYMPKAYHPLLLQQHRQNQRMARKDSTNTNVSALEQAQPVPVDFFIFQKTRVLIITGPNTGGKTICLKTVGLAAMMAKSGLHVLCSESVQIPWFDSVFADIGDEQSLSQSLSTFSGHLKQISDIRSQSTSQSLVLLDEVGAGTNPLEGAALGMSLLESFAESGALLTMATTHHGELKSLKYSNDAFENACMEFDEVNLKPTYKILWGVPGRSNAINISERLGLPSEVVSHARDLFGAASAEINEVILDMERFKQEFQQSLHESQRHLMLAREHRKKLLLARRKITEHNTSLGHRKTKQLSQVAATARSILHKKVRQLRPLAAKPSQPARSDTKLLPESDSSSITENNGGQPIAYRVSSVVETDKQSLSEGRKQLPEVGQTVQVSSLGRSAKVVRVDPFKEEIVVLAGNMKLKLKFADIVT